MQQHTRRGATALALSTLSCALLIGCSDDSGNASNPDNHSQHQAEIRYTQFGVPHITADSYRNLGFGIGYAQARDNLCTLSEQVLKLKGRKSEFFGPGTGNMNLATDFGYKGLDYPAQAAALYPNLGDNTKDIISGYVAGFNKSLAERAGPQDYPSPCRAAEWVTPLTPQDLLAYHLDLAGLASARNFLPAMPAAQPPAASNPLAQQLQLDHKLTFTAEGIGSNGWALGQEKVAAADSALLGNPHFPWEGELRFYQQHLTIPGELDVSGAGMVGLPAVVIGYNQDLGWTHTVSQSKRFTLYQLTLDPDDPTRYEFDGEYRDMTSKQVSVKVKLPDGRVIDQSQTLYFSHFGPMVNLASLSPALGWSNNSAISYRDANAGNTRMLEQWLAMGKASSRDEFFQAFADHQGIPWVNTIMIADDGSASYIDGTQVPQLSATAEGYWAQASQSPQPAPIWQDGAGSVLLPGNSSAFEWVDSGDAGAPGLVPFSKAPQQTRQDYVFNANSSHWLTNLEAPLAGYSLMYGPEETIRSTRTRYNAQLVSDNSGNGLAGADNRFTLNELQTVLSHNGSLFGDTFRNQLVQRCTDHSSIQQNGTAVDLTPACDALRNWDGQYNLDSKGAQLMREFLAAFRVSGHRALTDELFATPFDAAQPATTPAGLVAIDSGNVDNDPVLQALASAAQRLTDAGIALDAPLGSVQYLIKATGKAPVPVSGGYSYEGVFNMAESKVPGRSTSILANNLVGSARNDSPLVSLDEDGNGATERYRINYGSSFVLSLQYHDGQPTAEMLLAYSQSHDPDSEHFGDLTTKFSQLDWQPMWFSNDDIENNLVEKLLISD